MKYLLDTNIIVNYLRGKFFIPEKIIEGGSGICIISLAELYYGAYNSDNPEKSLAKLEDMLLSLGIETVKLDKGAAIKFGKLKAKLKNEGRLVDGFDLLIASTALENGLVLVTGNLKHFSRIEELKIYKS